MGNYISNEAMGVITCPYPQSNLIYGNKEALGSAVIAADDSQQISNFFFSVTTYSTAAKVLCYSQMDHKKRNLVPFK